MRLLFEIQNKDLHGVSTSGFRVNPCCSECVFFFLFRFNLMLCEENFMARCDRLNFLWDEG